MCIFATTARIFRNKTEVFMRLPSESECANDPVLNMLRNNDVRGFLCEERGKNKAFLNRRRVNTALSLLKNTFQPIEIY